MPTPRRVEAEVLEIQDFGHNVYGIILRVPRTYTRFRPGQFTHLSVESYDPSDGYWPESRVFSLASQPNAETIRLVYSVKGRYTERIREILHVGFRCWLKLPYGDFIVEKGLELHQPIVLVAGGTGITPFIPYLLDNEKLNPHRKVALYYGVRNPSLTIFVEELRWAIEFMSNLTINLYSEEHSQDERFKLGRLSLDDILSEAKQLENPVFFISGPPSMINNFKVGLIRASVSEKDIRIDKWE